VSKFSQSNFQKDPMLSSYKKSNLNSDSKQLIAYKPHLSGMNETARDRSLSPEYPQKVDNGSELF